jgi:hypothetical protein
MCDAVNARRGHPAGVEEHITCKKECTGSWEIPRLTSGNGTPWPASGRRGVEADDARTWEVGLCRSSYEAGEQGGAIRCGAGGAKGRDQGECGSAKHAPGSVPGKCVTGAGTHTASSPSSTRGRSRMHKGARTDLCGGRGATHVPTATAKRIKVLQIACFLRFHPRRIA